MERSAEEFPSIHAETRPRIHRYLARLVGEGEAEDLTQEVFVRVSRMDRLRGRSCADAGPGKGGAAREAPAEDVDASPDEKRPPIERQLMREQRSGCTAGAQG
jgi:hypothetical protein